MSNWKIITPLATINEAKNPSFEGGTTLWGKLGTNTIAQSLLQQKFGAYSLLCTYQDNTTLAELGLTLATASTVYSLSAWVYVPTGYDGTIIRLGSTNMASSSEAYPTVFTVGTDDFDKWVRIETTLTVDVDVVGEIIVEDTASPTAGQAIYLDAVQIEEQTAASTYCDGDQDGCVWEAQGHLSLSIRTIQTRVGGLLQDLEDDFGLPVEQMIGTGSTPMSTLTTPRALLPGREWQRSIAKSRVFSLVCTFRGTSLSDYHTKRQTLISALAPDGVGMSDPVILRYTGAAVDKQIEARYIGGLEMAGPDGFSEKVALRFQADDPFFAQIGNQARGMFTETATFTQVASRIDGQWSNMGPPDAAGTYGQIYDIAVSPTTGKVYVCGSFTNFDNIAAADYIVEWDPVAETWAALAETAGGIDDICRGLCFSPDGTLYAVGDWSNADGVALADKIAKWDGTGWTAVGDPATGATITSIDTCFFGHDGNLYVGGSFANLAGVADADSIAKWDGTSWTGVGGGAGAIVRVILQAPDLSIYIGGDFTTVGAGGATAALRVARFVKGITWEQVGSGFTNRVRGLSLDHNKGLLYAFGDFVVNGNLEPMSYAAVFKGTWRPMGEAFDAIAYDATTTPGRREILIGGAFTTVNDVETPDGLAIWNGSSFLPLDLSLEGPPTFYATAAVQSKIGSGFRGGPRRDDLYVGGDFVGETGTYPLKTAAITNNGTARVYPVMKFSRTGGTGGKITKLTNTTTDKSVYIDHDLLDGETITLDFRPGRLSMRSNAGVLGSTGGWVEDTSRWNILPQSILADFYILPGVNHFTVYYEVEGGATVTALIEWADTYWSVD